MKKVLVILMLVLAGLVFCEGREIVLSDLSIIKSDRQETVVHFNAELLLDKSVKVEANEVTSFLVSIYNENGNTKLYSGTTTNGVFHISDVLNPGRYMITIEAGENLYIGYFIVE